MRELIYKTHEHDMFIQEHYQSRIRDLEKENKMLRETLYKYSQTGEIDVKQKRKSVEDC